MDPKFNIIIMRKINLKVAGIIGLLAVHVVVSTNIQMDRDMIAAESESYETLDE